MARFDVHRDRVRPDIALLLIQSDLLDGMATRLVIPMIRESEFQGFVRGLHLGANAAGERYVIATDLMAAVQLQQLGPQVGSLAERSYEIIAAIDFSLEGF